MLEMPKIVQFRRQEKEQALQPLQEAQQGHFGLRGNSGDDK